MGKSLGWGKERGQTEVIAHAFSLQGRLVVAGRKVRDSLLRSRVRLRLEDQLEIQKVFWRSDTYLAACTKHAEYMNMIEHVHAT